MLHLLQTYFAPINIEPFTFGERNDTLVRIHVEPPSL